MKNIASVRFDVLYERALEQELSEMRAAICGGAAKDWGGYQFLCGQIRGIQVAIDALTRTREQWNRDGDQDL